MAIKAIDGLQNCYNGFSDTYDKACIIGVIEELPSARPDNRLSKIADLVEGTIDHFDLDDAMDLLYQIKEVLK